MGVCESTIQSISDIDGFRVEPLFRDGTDGAS